MLLYPTICSQKLPVPFRGGYAFISASEFFSPAVGSETGEVVSRWEVFTGENLPRAFSVELPTSLQGWLHQGLNWQRAPLRGSAFSVEHLDGN